MIQQARNRERIIRADRAYGAVNDWPETLGEPIKLLATILRDTPRLDGAACVDEDPELFFPDSRDYAAQTKAARICNGCPVRDTCSTWATETNQRQGVWGGIDRTTPIRSKATETHCKNGHPWTDETTYWNPRKNRKPYRVCKTCRTENLSESDERREQVGQLTRAGLSVEQIAVALRLSPRHVNRLRAAA